MEYKVRWEMWTTVEADSLDQAADIASGLDPVREGNWQGNFTLEELNAPKSVK